MTDELEKHFENFSSLRFGDLEQVSSSRDDEWKLLALASFHLASEAIRLGLKGDIEGATYNAEFSQKIAHTLKVNRDREAGAYFGDLFENASKTISQQMSAMTGATTDKEKDEITNHTVRMVKGITDVALNQRDLLDILLEWKFDD